MYSLIICIIKDLIFSKFEVKLHMIWPVEGLYNQHETNFQNIHPTIQKF